ncbi:MAG: NYN domain-containing protein, partial [Kiritimatiellales bacterium]|nr:NYN domain-containing protein [Kiritimatiellales bacterium]
LIAVDKPGARHRLIRQIDAASHQMATRTTIVFDGQESGNDAALTSRYLDVVFSPRNLSADTVIERMVYNAKDPLEIMVVTSDMAERTTVSSAGALTMSCREFLTRCDSASKASSRLNQKGKPPNGPRLGDFFPDAL